VQERQSRVCSTVAIAIVAETCGPFTCIPAILNEYRTAELNVRTGCLKALSFVFEYVGPQSAYYVDSVVTMLEDALTDRDLVHRQTASTTVKHLALGVAGLGCEDSMMYLMNRLAQLLRDLIARHRRRHGGYRSYARHAWPRHPPQLCATGPVPPCV
jgi:splicing factor 3B subunit 1